MLKLKQFHIILKALVRKANKNQAGLCRVSASRSSQPTAVDLTRLVANMDKTSPMLAVVSELIHFEVESQASGNANRASDSINLLWLSSKWDMPQVTPSPSLPFSSH